MDGTKEMVEERQELLAELRDAIEIWQEIFDRGLVSERELADAIIGKLTAAEHYPSARIAAVLEALVDVDNVTRQEFLET